MAQFESYNQFASHIKVELSKRTQEIASILYYWLSKSRNSEMFYKSDNGAFIINSLKARDHYKLVLLYQTILSISTVYRNSYNEERANERANKIASELELANSIDEIKNDFYGKRDIIKKNFQNIFSLYGLEFDDKVIDRLFGRIQIKKDPSIDTISLFASDTSLAGSLSSQFRITKSGKANGLFSAFFMRAAGLLDNYGNEPISVESEAISCSSTNNPFFREKQAMRILVMVYVSCHSSKNYST